MLLRLIIASLVGFAFTQSIEAQVCQREITPQSVASSNFDFSNGEAKDRITGLIWLRCVVGQVWNATTSNCDGSPQKMTWQEALLVAAPTEWRVPDIKELNSVLDLQCAAPPFNAVVFPNMPASEDNGFWSSTPFTKAATNTNAWWVDLMFGKMDYRSVLTTNFVLLVKSP